MLALNGTKKKYFSLFFYIFISKYIFKKSSFYKRLFFGCFCHILKYQTSFNAITFRANQFKLQESTNNYE